LGDFKDLKYETFPWAEVIARIQADDDTAATELYNAITPGLKFIIRKRLGYWETERAGDDILQETFRAGLYAIRRDGIEEPRATLGYFRQILNCQIAKFIESEVKTRTYHCEEEEAALGIPDNKSNPEKDVILRQEKELLQRALEGLAERDREILKRFYLLEQPQSQIKREMNLTETQFRLYKSRAKEKFGIRGRQLMADAEFCRIVRKLPQCTRVKSIFPKERTT